MIEMLHNSITADIRRRFTIIWQSKTPHEQAWIDEIFGPWIKDQVYDGEHRVVMEDAILCDAFLTTTPIAYYEAFRGRRCFLVNFLDENYDGGYERYAPFLGVFRKHWAAMFEADPRIRPLPLGYCNGFAALAEVAPASRRPHVWSFVGAAEKSSRPDMLRALKDVDPNFVTLTDDLRIRGYKFSRGRVEPERSAEILRQSVFAPAPMGNVNLECFRVYEALEAGAIPLVEERRGLRYWQTLLGTSPLPIFTNWRSAARFVRQASADPQKLDALQAECLNWWHEFKARYTADAGAFMAERLHARETPAIRLPYSRRWQFGELLRHQTPATLLRRAKRQAVRLVTSGKLRVAHGT